MELVLEGCMRPLEGSDRSTMGMLVTLAQFIGCSLLALIMGGARKSEDASTGALWKDLAKAWWPYVGLSVLVWGATGLANVSVTWVQYPVKVAFKSSKLIPTMVVSVFMRNSRPFRWSEYVAAVLLCIVTAAFSIKAGTSNASTGLVVLGIAFLFSSMMCDALATNTQQSLMQRSKVHPLVMMLRLNLCGMLVSILVILCSGKIGTAATLILARPQVLGYMAGVGGCIAVGVWANTQLIHESGSVVAVGVATVRKVVTMVLSYIIYPKPLQWMHVVGIVLMACGLGLAELMRKPTQPTPDPEQEKLIPTKFKEEVKEV
jgi:adenosine 3'-phospho 5'-phosphosulfate transporter B3